MLNSSFYMQMNQNLFISVGQTGLVSQCKNQLIKSRITEESLYLVSCIHASYLCPHSKFNDTGAKGSPFIGSRSEIKYTPIFCVSDFSHNEYFY